jgi:hypothetical protein
MYSVFINKRPIRFAFLIDPQGEKWQEHLDSIWEYTLDKWQGRFNVIIPTNGEVIGAEWWEFFKRIDPDYVIATTAITDALKDQINSEIHPIDVELPRPNQPPDSKPKIFTYNDTIPIVPSSQTLSKTSRVPFPLPPSPILANLQPGWTADSEVKRFVVRNFGSYPNIVFWNNVLDDIAHVNFLVDTKSDLVKALSDLSRPEVKAVYPIQVSSLDGPMSYIDYEHEHSYDVFGLIVGDTFEEQVFSWHKVLFSSTVNQSHRLNHLWLPSSFARDAELMETLGTWLRGMTEHVHVFSFSISEDELSAIGNMLDPPPADGRFVLRTNLYRTVTTYTRMPYPKFTEGRSFSFWDRYSPSLQPPKNADHFRAYGMKEELEIRSPALAAELRERGHWMADVLIEVDKTRLYPEASYSQTNTVFWWQVPRKNYLASWIFSQKARIDVRGLPAVQLPAQDPRLRFKLPSDGELLRMCILGDRYAQMAGNVTRRDDSIDEIDFSANGRYLNGFIKVFGGLAPAHNILSERFWRQMFDRLAGRDLSKDQKTIERVRGKLRKRIKKGLTLSEILENFENLADYVIQLAREIGSEGQSQSFAGFVEEAKAEHELFKQEEKVDWEFSERGVKEEISRMLEVGVLQMGFDQRCPRCGSTNWFVIDDARQEMICDGCRYKYSMPAEPMVTYRLSSLVRQGVFAHGLVPVVLTLGQLLRDSGSSFFFSPSVDVLQAISDEPRTFKLVTDLDVVCIRDGKFIIGEVKTSQARFELERSLILAQVAEAIGADVLLFSSLEDAETDRTKEMIEAVRDRLKNTKIDVGWYQLGEEVFEASRMDF